MTDKEELIRVAEMLKKCYDENTGACWKILNKIRACRL